ncbi:MAG TPA: M48 family metallopeptidase [Quisquiliibacterium sp.]|nr:M48 family metallopeptidase [Quisquiliibacterium sp.]
MELHRTRFGWLPALALALGLSIGLSACQSVKTTGAGVVGVDRQQRMSPLVSEAELREGAIQAYREELVKERQKGALNPDPRMTVRVKSITSRLIPATGAFRPDAPGWTWEVNVIRSDSINAWCMPGGKIAVYSGLIDKLALTDDEIAAVLGHEIAHALREHARERASEQVTAGLLISGGAAVLGSAPGTIDMAKLAYQVTMGLPNSRLHESEADRMGVELAARAGYDPRAAITLWQKMGRASGGKGPEWLSTHPAAETRLRDLEVYSTRVEPLYQQAKSRR